MRTELLGWSRTGNLHHNVQLANLLCVACVIIWIEISQQKLTLAYVSKKASQRGSDFILRR